MERTTAIPQVGAAAVRGQGGGRLATAWADALTTWLQRSRQRRALHRLDERMLKDIGLSRADVEREADKPFWR